MTKLKLICACMACVLLVSALALPVGAFRGDVTGDNKISANDYFLLKRYVLKQVTFSAEQLAKADVTGDNKINASDYFYLKRSIVSFSYRLDMVKEVLESKELKTNYSGQIAGMNGTVTIRFVTENKKLILRGHAETTDGIVIDLDMPFPAISDSYSFTAHATMDNLGGNASGTLNAKTYTVDDDMIDNLTFSDTGTVKLNATMKKTLNTMCKEAMDIILALADQLLADETLPKDLTIGSLGFTQFKKELTAGKVKI